MPASTPSNTSIPASTTEGTHQLNTQDASNGSYAPQTMPGSPHTSGAIEPAYAPIYPQTSLLHRTSLTAADTSNPTAVPSWIGTVSAAYASGTTLHVKPLAGYGAPPTGNMYAITAAAVADNGTINSQSGGAGVDYTLTLAAGLGHAHASGDYVVVVATGGIATNNAASVPTGPIGGPGFDWVDFYAALTFGSAAAEAVALPRLWNARVGQFFDTSATVMDQAATGTQYTVIRVETHGAWAYAAVKTLTGAGAAITIDAVVG